VISMEFYYYQILTVFKSDKHGILLLPNTDSIQEW
jgi:hypothetical protein